MHDLKTLGGDDSIALFVNDLGQIAGASDVNTSSNTSQIENPGGPTVHPFIWQWGKMHDLTVDAAPGSFGGTYGIVSSLNNRGQVIGVMNMEKDVTWHSYLWENGKMRDIGTLGGTFATAQWLNDSGVIVGRSSVNETCDSCASGAQGQFSNPFIYKDGNMTDLGLPNGAQCATAKQINEKGEIVGQSFLQVSSISLDICGSAATGAFVVYANGSIYDLQTLLVPGSDITLNDSFNINDAGEIVGTGINGNGEHRVVLLVPCD